MRHILHISIVISLIVMSASHQRTLAQIPQPNPNFDFDTGNAVIEVIIPTVIPALAQTTTLNDAPIILRHTTLITNAWFDAIAPYHPTAVGVFSRLGRRPASEATTNRNKNIAMFYASFQLLNRLMPRFTTNWRNMLLSVGLNPDDGSENLASPVASGTSRGEKLPRCGSATA